MESRAIQLYSFGFASLKTYLLGFAFAVGNIVLPQLCHLIPGGGHIFLPIYFFTLVAAFKYGHRVGLLTAVLSPVVNNLLFGMPVAAMLPVILVKSVLLAVFAAYAAANFKRMSLLILLAVVLAYQVVGSLAEWAIVDSLDAALADFRMGIPGMLLQIFGGYAVIKYLLRN
ncbi:ECF transporter S component [Xiashengella succiniciproducens]|uniref:ECF transporter S component n=1 Tax=Xiashengella succiniciproducens TaxID=2949635 RepID=A0A9J6ZPE7_9BACT|nr:ECF transporter S component [Alkaliflexus sp. Ai-910]URW79407.1 ECF transporter S component [Alkaliflexus sp. Ai-910]